MITIRIVAVTHTGLVRDRNEDHYGATALAASRQDGELVTSTVAELPCLAVVADGLGGHPAGEIASSIAVDRILAAKPVDGAELVAAVHEANRAFVDAMSVEAGTVGMGTTVAAVLLHDGGWTAVNVGDSADFELANDRMVQLSTDDSPAGRSSIPGLPSAVVTQTLGGGRDLLEIDPHIHSDVGAVPRRLLSALTA